jgi:transcriptional regulator with XRE-family HTH domain
MEFSKSMNFGVRLAEERKRLGLKQAEFADLVGTDVPKQSLYETGKRELRADYLARLAETDVDVLYVLTGRRSEGERIGMRASELLSAYLGLPDEVQHALLALADAIRGQFARPAPTSLHSRTLDYRAED